MKQRTIRNSFTIEGKGLHTGLPLTLTLKPASENHGIKIRRTDITDAPLIEAIADNVCNTLRGTVLCIGDVQVSTIEHALAALYAYNIDNCLMEVNGPEFPILDGSSKPYVEHLNAAGITEQNLPAEYIEINEDIEYVSDTGSVIRAYPSYSLELEVEIGFDSEVLQYQMATLTDIRQFPIEIAAARTFVFVHEIEPLLNMNLIKGGDLKNAIVIYDRLMSQEAVDKLSDKLHQPCIDASKPGYLSGELNFENEPARHKLLDLLGDLALTGKRLKGRMVAFHPGHKVNTEFAKLLRKKYILTEK
jgi:UDP-3-O-[3-hydroxymyristoyl] N-acetylglucosamine deacetylase / 3-hydroxyacyl-[acyl-carrier-protein] dehydratase